VDRLWRADIRRYIFNKKKKKQERNPNQCILTSTFIVQMLCHLPARTLSTPLSSFILKVFTPYFYLSQQKSKKEYYYNFVFFSPQKVLFHCDSPPLSIILCPKGGKLLYYYLYFMTNDKMYPLINNMIIIAAVNRDLKKWNKPSSAKRFKAERSHQKSVHAILHKILSAKPHSFKEFNKSVTPSLLFSVWSRFTHQT